MPDLPERESVDHPPHYNSGRIEVIDFIEDQGLGFHLGNVVKYVCRAEHKGAGSEDIDKAMWYLTRFIELRRGTLITTTERNYRNEIVSSPTEART